MLRLTCVHDPQGLTWEYEYDAAGRLISDADFEGVLLRPERAAELMRERAR
ncbi:RHS repeat domain-containing protein [Streptomyces sp. NPDC058279]|uniref:RHS repeat domain-containing protein n=1 Tax=Streptomyces sp. NPDC058279 TaxID=3346418 RepID=UPI0036E8F5A9